MDFKNFLQSKLTTVFLVAMIAVVFLMAGRLWIQKQEVDNEVSVLQKKADSIRKENQQLSELTKYLSTDEYAQRQAREKLNLKKEGEHVVVLPKSAEDEAILGSSQEEKSNRQKWFDYFFN